MKKEIIWIVVLVVVLGGIFYVMNSPSVPTLPVEDDRTEVTEPGNIVEGSCYVGGCSGQICSDEPGAVSTCEFREEYACYQSARCERQTNGQCGWTMTEDLQMCLGQASN